MGISTLDASTGSWQGVADRAAAGRYALRFVLVAAVYVLSARVGLHLAYANKNVTAVWPPTGVAVSVLLLSGYGMAPAITLGAFVANLTNGAGLDTSLLISMGNTLAPCLGVFLAVRVAKIGTDLTRVRDVVGIVLLGGPLSMTVSAFLGTASLLATGKLSGHAYWSVWLTWWIGDAVGVVIVAPLVLSVAGRSWRDVDFGDRKAIEAAGLLLTLVGASLVLFQTRVPVAFLLFPLAAWASVRFLQFGAVIAVSVVSLVSITSTLAGHGPFVAGLSTTGSLSALQAFNAALALSALLLAAVTLQERHAEEGLRRSAEELESQVDRRTVELQESLAQLRRTQDALVRQERLAAIGEMATTVGHELRNPLAAVMTNLFLVREGLNADENAKLLQHLDLAERESMRAASLSEEITTYARRRDPSVEPLDLRAVLDEVLVATPPPSSVTVTMPSPGFSVVADRSQLNQILTNVVTNAYAAMPDGGTMQIVATRRRGSVEISLRDDGEGIASEHAKYIFEPFFTTRAQGTGLGLAIVKNLVDAHGGSVAIENVPDGGAQVTICFPDEPPPPAD